MSDLELDYRLTPGGTPAGVDLASADEATLRYTCFPGDIRFVAGRADFSAPWGWVPVLDFAVSLRAIAAQLVTEGHQTFEFTESDAEIDFVRRDALVAVCANYATGAAEVRHADLSLAAEGFLARVVGELTDLFPALGANPYVQRLAAELAVTR